MFLTAWNVIKGIPDDGFKVVVVLLVVFEQYRHILNWTRTKLHRFFQSPRKPFDYTLLLKEDHQTIPLNLTNNTNQNLFPWNSKSSRWKISIHTFAWRREKSLRRLFDSLLRAKYFGYEIPLYVHIDGEPLDSVVQYVERQFRWPHGPLYIDRRSERLGMPMAILDGWNPPHDDEYAILLEDDVEVAVGFFEFVLYCLEFSTYKRMVEGEDHGMMGCSLYTPRVNEIGPAPNAWSPPTWHVSKVIYSKYRLFYFQLPCSWGAVYHSKYWRRFLQYFKLRQQIDQTLQLTSKKFPETPNSRSNEWFSSWKRILIELMLFEGWYLLYPSFPNQISFSTNYFERGIHSVPEGRKPEIPDELKRGDRRFTVPLWSDFGFRPSLPIPCLGLVKNIPYVNLYHRRALNRQELFLDVRPVLEAVSIPELDHFFWKQTNSISFNSSQLNSDGEMVDSVYHSSIDLVDFDDKDDEL